VGTGGGRVAVLVMARAPLPGRVKTRLEPVFTRAECAAIQELLIRRTVRWAVDAAAGAARAAGADGPAGGGAAVGGGAEGGAAEGGAAEGSGAKDGAAGGGRAGGGGAASGERARRAVYIAYDPPDALHAIAQLVPDGVELIAQRGDHLGERLANAVAEVHERHPGPLLVVGTDTRLTPAHARAATDELEAGADAVFGPALDGGYYLIALARPAPQLFTDIGPEEWGGPRVLERSLEAAARAGLATAQLGQERDLDTPADAEALQDDDPELGELLKQGLSRPLVSIVIPTRDEAEVLPGLLDHLGQLGGRFDVVIADGGSADGTIEAAQAHPLAPRVITRAGGRAEQMNAGADAANGDPIVFLHADTRLPPNAYATLTATDADGGNFAIEFDGADTFSEVLGAWYRVQRRLGVYYGDSAIWVRRRTFERLGGYRPLPIMDDYDFARRLERAANTACLPGPARTSARRWRALGVPRTVFSWVVIRWLFVAGVPPERLARLYRRAR
jgi:rSAM/selenodomain-associated transferase 2